MKPRPWRRVVERLRQQFPEVPPDALEAVVNGHYEAFDGRPVRDFVPVLVERATRADLEAGIESPAPADRSMPHAQAAECDGARRPPDPSQLTTSCIATGTSVR